MDNNILLKLPSFHKGLWVTILVVILLVISYSVMRYSEITYWDGAVGNCLATLIGVIAGVPIALLLSKSDKNEEQARIANEQMERAEFILNILHHELTENLLKLVERRDKPDKWNEFNMLKTSSWDTVKTSGGLSAIKDQRTLKNISDAYYYIAMIYQLEWLMTQIKSGIGASITTEEGKMYFHRIQTQSRAYDKLAIAMIVMATAYLGPLKDVDNITP